MLIYEEFEAFARISECLGLLINGGFIAMDFILWIFCLFSARLRSVRDEASKLDRLCQGSTRRFWFSFFGLLLVGVVFFPSLPFMGVMLFPSFALGNASGEGGAPLVPLSPFYVIFSLPLLSSLSSSFPLFFHISFFLFPFLPHKLLPSPFLLLLFSISFLSFSFFSSFPSLSFPFPSFFLHEVFFLGTACTKYLGDVRDDTSDCN